MREYKFRAWDMVHEEMIHWDQYKDEMVSNDFEDDELKIMQWTGVKDTKGKDIYEGDIIQFDPPHHLKHSSKNKSENYVVRYIADKSFRGIKEKKSSIIILNLINAQEGLRVLGNIFENPELIKEEI